MVPETLCHLCLPVCIKLGHTHGLGCLHGHGHERDLKDEGKFTYGGFYGAWEAHAYWLCTTMRNGLMPVQFKLPFTFLCILRIHHTQWQLDETTLLGLLVNTGQRRPHLLCTALQPNLPKICFLYQCACNLLAVQFMQFSVADRRFDLLVGGAKNWGGVCDQADKTMQTPIAISRKVIDEARAAPTDAFKFFYKNFTGASVKNTGHGFQVRAGHLR